MNRRRFLIGNSNTLKPLYIFNYGDVIENIGSWDVTSIKKQSSSGSTQFEDVVVDNNTAKLFGGGDWTTISATTTKLINVSKYKEIHILTKAKLSTARTVYMQVSLIDRNGQQLLSGDFKTRGYVGELETIIPITDGIDEVFVNLYCDTLAYPNQIYIKQLWFK